MVSSAEVAKWLNVKGMRVVPCHSSQLNLMTLYPEAQYTVDSHEGYRERIDAMGRLGCGWTVIGDARCLAMFGISKYWDGCAEAWLMVDTKGISKRRVTLTKATLRFFDNVGAAFDLRRCQIVVSVANKHALSWSKLLGFEIEATLKRYGPDGSDHLVLARFYD